MYSRIARARRRYYQHRPHLRRRLSAPVISIGNLTVGGSGKTPLAAEVARLLLAIGERPSILSRGYARQIVDEGVVVVSDGYSVLTGVERSGDEPQMLARAVPGAPVLVSSSRYAAGRIAEGRLGCTVHVLDDGFQHFDLMRDIDLLVPPDRSESTRTLPFGRLREPLDAASMADALLVDVSGGEGLDPESPAAWADPPTQPRFTFSRRLAGPVSERPVFAFAGIARPQRFFRDLETAGWTVAGQGSFGDHHHYSARDIQHVVRAAELSGAEMIVTTEKDFVRIGARQDITAIPLQLEIEPAFGPWLARSLRAVRSPDCA